MAGQGVVEVSIWWRRKRETTQTEKRYWDYRPLDEVLAGLVGRSYQDTEISSAESSLQVVAVRSAVDLLASICAETPLEFYRGTGADRVPVKMPGYLEDPSGDGQGLEDWIYQVAVSWLLRGNFYGHIIDQGPTGMLRQVAPWHPDTVNVHWAGDRLVWIVQGREVPESQVLHRRVNPIPGIVLGLSPIAAHAATLGVNLASTRFGQQWFKDGAHPGGILSNSEAEVGESAARVAKERFLAALFGSREPLVLGKGWKFDQVQVAPEESQFLETQNFSAAECCRIFGPGIAEVLGYDTGGTMQYSNAVDRDLAVLKYAANKWLKRFERLLSQFLPRPQYAVYNRDAFLETNPLDRWRKHEIALRTGAVVINEVRDEENKPRVPWGDQPWAQSSQPASPPSDGDQQDNPPQEQPEEE